MGIIDMMVKVSSKKSFLTQKPLVLFLCLVFLCIGIVVGICVNKNQTVFVAQKINQEPEYLILQEAESGSLVPLPGETDMYTLTLKKYDTRTLFFADRPKRVVGSIDTKKFITTWDQGENSFQKNPPNAALTVNNPTTGKDDVTVLELSHPVFDASTQTLSYTAKAIKRSLGIHIKNPILTADFPASFKKPILYIDSIIATVLDFELPMGYRDPDQTIHTSGQVRQ